ncbi:CG9576 [Drosophila busckii]|uniref:CG9576 n=1 Tax=Drosophila busckii TaxID=30019 RepID=A0A0M5J5U3_DROBS|nr:uncharacterized protein LOC108605737 [Drosophila busckii]ALC48461.1 CG9576 [Drosophila busckii]
MDKCIFCLQPDGNELQLGEFYKRADVCVHHNCLYLTSNLVQRGRSRDGIIGFLLKDIKSEAQRVRSLVCRYCHRSGANIGCCIASCRSTFHTQCGIKNGAQNQFIGSYKSFCRHHVIAYKERPTPDEPCNICFNPLLASGERFQLTKHLHGKCCMNGWYHKDCLQRYANTAGYFFKCPLCNNMEQFRNVAYWGISVPDRDAAWEQNDDYADQQEVPTDCTAVECKMPKGRAGSTSQLLYCHLCGSNPMHPKCTNFSSDNYCCNDCISIETDSDNEEELDPLNKLAIAANGTAKRRSVRVYESESDDDWIFDKLTMDSENAHKHRRPEPVRKPGKLALQPRQADNISEGPSSSSANKLHAIPVTATATAEKQTAPAVVPRTHITNGASSSAIKHSLPVTATTTVGKQSVPAAVPQQQATQITRRSRDKSPQATTKTTDLKPMDISCIAKRTRTTIGATSSESKPHSLAATATATVAEQAAPAVFPLPQHQARESRRRSRDKTPEATTKITEMKPMDISCIAKRTRTTIGATSTTTATAAEQAAPAVFPLPQHQARQSRRRSRDKTPQVTTRTTDLKPIDISCVARRTRGRSRK